jgi:hypothetical protein
MTSLIVCAEIHVTWEGEELPTILASISIRVAPTDPRHTTIAIGYYQSSINTVHLLWDTQAPGLFIHSEYVKLTSRPTSKGPVQRHPFCCNQSTRSKGGELI